MKFSLNHAGTIAVKRGFVSLVAGWFVGSAFCSDLVTAADSVPSGAPLAGTGDLFSGWADSTATAPAAVALINTQNPEEIIEEMNKIGGSRQVLRRKIPASGNSGIPHGLTKILRLRDRIEELSGLPCLLVHYTQLMRDSLERPNVKAIVLTAWKPRNDKVRERELQEMVRLTKVPLIGFCGAHHFIYLAYGGRSGIMRKLKPGEADPYPKYAPGLFKEWNCCTVRVVKRDPLFDGLPDAMILPQRHYAQCTQLPAEFDLLASTDECRVQAIKHKERLLYGTQFHPELYDDDHPHGKILLQNFFRIAGATAKP